MNPDKIKYSKHRDEELPHWKTISQKPTAQNVLKYAELLEERDDPKMWIAHGHAERLEDDPHASDPTDYSHATGPIYLGREGTAGTENWQLGHSKTPGMYSLGFASPHFSRHDEEEPRQAKFFAELNDVMLSSFLGSLPESHEDISRAFKKFVPDKYKFSKLIDQLKVRFTK